MKRNSLILGFMAASAVAWSYQAPTAAEAAGVSSSFAPGAAQLDAREAKMVHLKLPAMV